MVIDDCGGEGIELDGVDGRVEVVEVVYFPLIFVGVYYILDIFITLRLSIGEFLGSGKG